MTARVGRVDHPVAAVHSLEQARDQFMRLGFVVPPIGHHQEWGTANVCIMFSKDYLEIRGIADSSKFLAGLDKYLAHGEGLCGVAFNTASADASHEAGVESGLGIEPPRHLNRKLVLGDRTLDLHFKTVMLSHDLYPGLTHANLCEHLTADTLRQPGWLEHANGVTGFARLVGVTDDFDKAQVAYTRLLGARSVRREPLRLWLHFDAGADIELISHAEAVARSIAQPVRGSHYMAAAVLAVNDLDSTLRLLQANQIRVSHTPYGLKVDPADACGARLFFQSKNGS